MKPLDKSHTCLFFSDTFRENSFIRSRLMHLFLFRDKTCRIPITAPLPALITDLLNTTSLFVDGSDKLPTFSSIWHFLTSRFIMSYLYLVHHLPVLSGNFGIKRRLLFLTWKFIYGFSDILALELQSSVLHRFVSSTQSKDLQCLVISAVSSLG